jgi:hypothetical protein
VDAAVPDGLDHVPAEGLEPEANVNLMAELLLHFDSDGQLPDLLVNLVIPARVLDALLAHAGLSGRQLPPLAGKPVLVGVGGARAVEQAVLDGLIYDPAEPAGE